MEHPAPDNLRPALLRFARTVARDAEEAEDLVQECLAVLHVRRTEIRCEQATLAWCRTVVHNLFRRRLRREWYGRIQHLPLQDAPESCVDPWDEVDTRLTAEGLLQRLQGPGRAAAREFYLGRAGVADLARQLGRPPGTIKRWLHDSREEMRMSAVPSDKPKAYAYGSSWGTGVKAAVRSALLAAGYAPEFRPLGEQQAPARDGALYVLAENQTGRSGLELLLTLRADHERPDVPVVLLGSPRQSAIVAAWKAGADVYLTKVDEEELAAMLRQLRADAPAGG